MDLQHAAYVLLSGCRLNVASFGSSGIGSNVLGDSWGVQQRGFSASASLEPLTHTPRTDEEFELAKAQFSQVVTSADRASAGDVSEEALDNGLVFHVMGKIPILSYLVPPKEVFAVVQIGAHQHKVQYRSIGIIFTTSKGAVGQRKCSRLDII
jgi:hypothetical protein